MKKIILLLAIAICCWVGAYSQATSLTVDCQTPGWLSSMINYGDQLTLKHLKVNGYINGTDLQFLRDLVLMRHFNGSIDLEDVNIVKGGTLNEYPFTVLSDNTLPYNVFNGMRNRKIILPSHLEKKSGQTISPSCSQDSVIWTNTTINNLYTGYMVDSNCRYLYLNNGVQVLNSLPNNCKIVFPNSINEIISSPVNNLIIYSYIENPETVYSRYEYYNSSLGHSYWATIAKSIFYIPKGTLNKYLVSDFATMKSQQWDINGIMHAEDNQNIFIEYYDVDSTIVNNRYMQIYKGDSAIIDVDVYPDTNLVSYINYCSSDTSLISVDNNGFIMAKNYGNAFVVVTPHVFIDGLETKIDTCFVQVIAHTEGIQLSQTETIHIGETKNLNAQTLPLGLSDNNITYNSSDISIATVDETGNLFGVKRGTCVITACTVDGGYEAQCLVTVIQPVEAISLDKHSLSIKVGESESLHYNILPTNADNKKVLWSANDTTIATVDNNGTVTGKKAGNTVIKVVTEDNPEVSDSCVVKVTQPVTGITLDHTTGTIYGIGNKLILTATVLPEDASNKDVNWTSSDQSVCFVSNGEVIGLSFGTSVIIATTVDGGFPATCVVNVKQARGDVNGDGSVNVTDVTALVNMILGVISKDMERADINGDGKINVTDVTSLVNIILGIK